MTRPSAEDRRQELMDDDPLVMPRDDRRASGTHGLPVASRCTLSPDLVAAVDDTVVELRKATCSPAMIRFSSFRGSAMMAVPSVVARQILEQSPALDPHLCAIVRFVELRILHGTTAVDRIEVERRRARVWERSGGVGYPKLRRRVEGHVVVEKLPEERDAGLMRRAVTVVRAQLGIRDQTDGTFDAAGSFASSIPPGAPIPRRRQHLRRRLGERRQLVEDPAEPIRPRMCRELRRGELWIDELSERVTGSENDGTCGTRRSSESGEETTPADTLQSVLGLSRPQIRILASHVDPSCHCHRTRGRQPDVQTLWQRKAVHDGGSCRVKLTVG